MTNEQRQLESEAMEVLEMLEDMVEYVCKEHTISGEKVYFLINELSRIKLNELPMAAGTAALEMETGAAALLVNHKRRPNENPPPGTQMRCPCPAPASR